MRFVGTGLLMLGALITGAAIITEDAGGALIAIVAGGFLFVSGSVFATGAVLQDAIKRNR